MKKRRSPISVKLAVISGPRLCGTTELAEVRKKPFQKEEKALVRFDAVGHSGSYIQSELVNPIYAAGNPENHQ